MTKCAATSTQSPDPAIITYVRARCTVNEIHSNRSRNRYEKHSSGNNSSGGMKAIKMITIGVIETNGDEDESRTDVRAKGI